MISVNVHEAKTHLSKLLIKIETNHEVVTVCRNGKPVAKIVPVDEIKNPLTLHPELQGVKLLYDPVEPLSEDEWPSED